MHKYFDLSINKELIYYYLLYKEWIKEYSYKNDIFPPDKLETNYHFNAVAIYAELAEAILRENEQQINKIYDFGCGSGILSGIIAERMANKRKEITITGIDKEDYSFYWKKIIERLAQKNLKNSICFKKMDYFDIEKKEIDQSIIIMSYPHDLRYVIEIINKNEPFLILFDYWENPEIIKEMIISIDEEKINKVIDHYSHIATYKSKYKHLALHYYLWKNPDKFKK